LRRLAAAGHVSVETDEDRKTLDELIEKKLILGNQLTAEEPAAHTPKPTIPIFVVRAVAVYPEASQGAGCGTSA
jgi:hypothetical protein